MEISLKEAKRIALASQGLLSRQPFGRGIDATERAVKQLHYVQIDTISVVARAHNHILKTRVTNYEPEMLLQLQKERRVFEYWAHAAAYLPIENYRYYQAIMAGYAKKRTADKRSVAMVLKRIKAEGALQSKDFEAPTDHKSGGWWDWKPAKKAMEYLFLSGELMVSERRGFQKVYDLRERVLPSEIDTSMPSDLSSGQFYISRMLTSQGIADAKEIAYAATTVRHLADINIRPLINAALEQMIADGQVLEVKLLNKTYYVLADYLEKLPKRLGAQPIRFLSPFDNLVINRNRLSQLFDFDYQLECYVPEAKRKFGYFCLPILYGDQFVGRLDCKALRKTKTLQVRNIWFEPGVKTSEKLIKDLAAALNLYSKHLDCDTIEIESTSIKTVKAALKKQIYGQ